MTAGLSAGGTYNGSTCANLYCHGNGRGPNGTYSRTGPSTTCSSCHASVASGPSSWDTMSTPHTNHLEQGILCHDCHSTVASTSGNAILNPTLHVNGQPDVSLTDGGVTRTAGLCSGTCHDKLHSSFSWTAGP
jgi:predicted CxxxxCH...CXXCH cytochrome family protein